MVVMRTGRYNKRINTAFINMQLGKQIPPRSFTQIRIGRALVGNVPCPKPKNLLIAFQQFWIVIKKFQLFINIDEILRNNRCYADNFSMSKLYS